jgi:hypothetical protein
LVKKLKPLVLSHRKRVSTCLYFERTAMAEPIWLTEVPPDVTTVALRMPVGEFEDSETTLTCMAALEAPDTLEDTCATPVIPAGAVNVVTDPLVPLRTAAKVSRSAFCWMGVIDGIRTLGKATPVLLSTVGVTSSGAVVSAPWIAADTAVNRPEV